jgi:cold shock CspA family protein
MGGVTGGLVPTVGIEAIRLLVGAKDSMDLPEILISQVREGKAVLFLGAGASLGAKTADGQKAPSTQQLGARLADKFLGGRYKDHPLHQIAEYAVNEGDLGTVQTFIKDLLEPLEPTQAHLKACEFTWYGIATTNYDRLIERAYTQNKESVQKPKPLIENTDKVEDNQHEAENVLLLKLHGCVTRVANAACPLILTTDQYLQHRRGRDRLFEILQSWAYEHPIVFIGSSLQDTDIRAIISELTQNIGDFRPRYYIVAPDVDEIKARFWDTKRITAIKGTFEEFIVALDARVPKALRGLGVLRSTTAHPLEERFKVRGATISKAAALFLENDVDYVRALTKVDTIDPPTFYKGFHSGFAAIEQQLDVRRKIGDSILADYFLRDIQEESNDPEVVLLKAHAGAGKSVMLRRIAWDASHEYDRICLFLKEHGVINVAALQELISSCRERLFLFVDDAVDHVRELLALFRGIGREGKLLTVILGERINEWNIQAQSLLPHLSEEYELKYLSFEEIDSLLSLLEKNKSLGTLARLDLAHRRIQLADQAGRQLLVALHEATLGRRFEDILVDEFKNVQPYEAQRMYLTICVLNRLGVPVRAGLIARVHGIPFTEFKARLFAPLEHVVFAEKDPVIRDYTYRARHPHIAEVVFSRILSNAEERFDAYIRTLKALALAYLADEKAFWQMTRARKLTELFPDRNMVTQIFRAARGIVGEDPHLLHQMALYEIIRDDGNQAEAARLLKRAGDLAPWDLTIKHSVAELKLRSSETVKTELEKNKLLRDAANIAASMISSEKTDSYAFHTLAKARLRILQEALTSGTVDIEIEKLAKEVEQTLFDALQRFPGDAYLLETESQLATTLEDDKRAISALEKAFAANNRSGFIALRLASSYKKQGEFGKAQTTLEKALAANPAEPRLHYAFAKLLMQLGTASSETLLYHLQRSFRDGDSNYDAQVLYGRQLFLTKDYDGSRKVFAKLSGARIGPLHRNKLLYPIEGQLFQGQVSKREAGYCFIARDGAGDWIYAHASNMDENTWKQLILGSRVEFRIAFSIRGVKAFEVHLV